MANVVRIKHGELKKLIKEVVEEAGPLPGGGAGARGPWHGDKRSIMMRAISGFSKHEILDQLGIDDGEKCTIRMNRPGDGQDRFLVRIGRPLEVSQVVITSREGELVVPVEQESTLSSGARGKRILAAS